MKITKKRKEMLNNIDLDKIYEPIDAIKLLKVGESAKIIIPSYLGFGVSGYGELVPPYSTLLLNIKLLNVKAREFASSGSTSFKNVKPASMFVVARSLRIVSKKLENNNTAGFNVTIPYKKRVFKHLKTKNVHATQIGAVNCVSVGASTKGINTDWIGYCLLYTSDAADE